jgi:hypothetical protein
MPHRRAIIASCSLPLKDVPTIDECRTRGEPFRCLQTPLSPERIHRKLREGDDPNAIRLCHVFSDPGPRLRQRFSNRKSAVLKINVRPLQGQKLAASRPTS